MKNGSKAKYCFAASATSSTACFSPPKINLSEQEAVALARLVPLLGCGEEAASLAFDGLARRERDETAAHVLAAIAAEEREHEAMLKALEAALPMLEQDWAIQPAARRFHVQLGFGCAGVRLGRIAAIDAAVCTTLARLLQPDKPVSNDPAIAAILRRIHRDEARHVRVSRKLAAQRVARAELVDLAAGARHALADVLMLAAAAFETLGVDPDALGRELRHVPRGLFAQ